MSRLLITKSYIDDIADAIREKTGDTSGLTLPQMANAITNMSAGIELPSTNKIVNSIGLQNEGDILYTLPSSTRLYSISISKANRGTDTSFNYVSASGIKLIFSKDGSENIDTSQSGVLLRGYSNKSPNVTMLDAFNLNNTNKTEHRGLPVIFYAEVSILPGYYLSSIEVRYRSDFSNWPDTWNTFEVKNETESYVVASYADRLHDSWLAYPSYNIIPISNDIPIPTNGEAYVMQNGVNVPIKKIFYTT